MAKKVADKFNDSCIKLFTFIMQLYEGDVEFKYVIDLLSDGKYDGTSNTHVTLNKYLNAMKIFGIKIRKINGKYRMVSSPYKLKLDLDDMKSISLLKASCSLLPNGKHKNNFQQFLRALEIRYDETANSLTQIADSTHNLNLKFYNSELVEQVKQCEKYCQDGLKLEILFKSEKGEELNIICSPIEQLFLKRRICLKVLGNNGNRVYEIPIENIISIKPLPSMAKKATIPTTVVYRIKNRLANNYKMRDCERMDTMEANGSKIIVNTNEDLNILIKRLMRYGTDCEIISPKFMREEMVKRLNETINNYETIV